MKDNTPRKGTEPMRVPDTRNYTGKHGKGCIVMAFVIGAVLASPFASVAYAIFA